jgi:tubulin--tyrosine ligase/tubulin polyglutamylase TTLL9
MKNIKYSVAQLTARMKEIISMTLYASYEKIIQCTKILYSPGNKPYQYEIFGYDFMLDSTCNLWLIEANTNPCLEQSSPLLEQLIPRMLSTSCGMRVVR